MQNTVISERRLPSLNAVRSFDAAARHLSFTLAARELCVTQGAVSRMVQALETELGVALLHRIGRTLKLTTAGAAYHPHILEALDRIAAASRSVRRMDGGVLCISVLPTFAMRWLVPRLPRFQQQYPDILVDITTNERLVNFSAEPIDIGIRYGLGQWPNAEATLFMPEDVAVYCSPALLQRGPPLRAPADLVTHRLLHHTTRPAAWQQYFAAYGLPTPDISQSPGFEHFFMVIEAAAAGMGVALLPLFLARAELASGRLVRPYEQTLRNEQAYYIAHEPGAGRTRKIRLVKEWLLEEAQLTLAENG
ncbi:transcriptional regulator GcvA [Undibacterium sp.]|uniref:transcriptional regulator GcvA n=1 Tax=Undibacterium sp. TaxID=1914977 RepID=UPI00374DA6AD